MGPEQLAGVMSIISRANAEARGQEIDEAADAAMRKAIEDQIQAEQISYFTSARVRDDGIIDPRDTRHVLAMALSAVHSDEVKGTGSFGVFRM